MDVYLYRAYGNMYVLIYKVIIVILLVFSFNLILQLIKYNLGPHN